MIVDYKVELGYHKKVSVNGKGVIVMYVRKGERKTIDDVYYLPKMQLNWLLLMKSTQF